MWVFYLHALNRLLGLKQSVYVIRLKIGKHIYVLIAKKKSDQNWRLRMKQNRQKLYSK